MENLKVGTRVIFIANTRYTVKGRIGEIIQKVGHDRAVGIGHYRITNSIPLMRKVFTVKMGLWVPDYSFIPFRSKQELKMILLKL